MLTPERTGNTTRVNVDSPMTSNLTLFRMIFFLVFKGKGHKFFEFKAKRILQ